MREPSVMAWETAKMAVDLMMIRVDDPLTIHFAGGEPFLEYTLMKKTADYIHTQYHARSEDIELTVTTNGTLLDRSRLHECLNRGIKITVSIDGNKKVHEGGRGKGTFEPVMKALTLIQEIPECVLSTQSVITPANVEYLVDSVRFLINQNTDEMGLSLQYDVTWPRERLSILHEQYSETIPYLSDFISRSGRVEFEGLSSPKSCLVAFKCGAGKRSMAVTPEGDVFACFMLIPWSRRAFQRKLLENFSDFCAGSIHKISYKKIIKNLEAVRQDDRLAGQFYRHTTSMKCRDCDYLFQCAVCPAISLIHSDDSLMIPDWLCTWKKLIFQQHKLEECLNR
jgi:radical SAM protein with 4Fe4S-binding SPASM domain